ncbi:MAG TPA: SDR family oxidoreductase [Candidatus Binataceae bacterium]|nr:SDR family oxidoreductase [Candidatus Binataceae bacterium]
MATALITGASSGLGEVFAHQLAGKGYDLVLTARREGRLVNVASKARQMGAKQVEVIAADLSHRDGPAAIMRELATRGLQIDYLVNNAGFGTSGRFDRLPLERELEEIDLNVAALVALTRLLVPAMVERRSGTIINVASTAGFQAVPYMSTYAATKAFVLSFTEGLAGELVGTGVKILALCPGPVKTEFQSVANNEKSTMPSFVYLDAETVVAQGIAAAANGRMVHIAGIVNFLTAELQRLMPRVLVNQISRRIYRPNADA